MRAVVDEAREILFLVLEAEQLRAVGADDDRVGAPLVDDEALAAVLRSARLRRERLGARGRLVRGVVRRDRLREERLGVRGVAGEDDRAAEARLGEASEAREVAARRRRRSPAS